MKHIEHATKQERHLLAAWEQVIAESKERTRNAVAGKRAIAERCRARARRHKEGQ